MNVYAAILQVKKKLDTLGVGKDKRVQQGPANYAYRSVDDVINAVGPLLTEAGVVTRITYRDHIAEDVTIVSKQGPRQAHRVKLHCLIEFIYADENGVVTAFTTEALGEGLDSGDKATNKAMSVSYKYALGLALPIPFVGRDDPDANQHELAVPKMAEEKIAEYVARIAQCEDVNVVRGITQEGLREAKEAGDREAQARILDAGKQRAATLAATEGGE